MDNGLKKIIELIKKTGDRLIVLETESAEPYVVMGLADYEKLIDGKISSDKQGVLPLSDSSSDFNDLADSELSDLPIEDKLKNIFDDEELNDELSTENREDQYYFEPLEQ